MAAKTAAGGGEPMNYALDGILVLVVLVFVLIGVRRGFVRSAAHFLGSGPGCPVRRRPGGAWPPSGSLTASSASPWWKRSRRPSPPWAGEMWAWPPAASSPLCRTSSSGCWRAPASQASPSPRGWTPRQGRPPSWVADALSPVFVGFLKVLAVLVLYLLFMMLVRVLADLLAGMFQLPLLLAGQRPAGRSLRAAAVRCVPVGGAGGGARCSCPCWTA